MSYYWKRCPIMKLMGDNMTVIRWTWRSSLLKKEEQLSKAGNREEGLIYVSSVYDLPGLYSWGWAVIGGISCWRLVSASQKSHLGLENCPVILFVHSSALPGISFSSFTRKPLSWFGFVNLRQTETYKRQGNYNWENSSIWLAYRQTCGTFS